MNLATSLRALELRTAEEQALAQVLARAAPDCPDQKAELLSSRASRAAPGLPNAL
jgi:hypothetical protein